MKAIRSTRPLVGALLLIMTTGLAIAQSEISSPLKSSSTMSSHHVDITNYDYGKGFQHGLLDGKAGNLRRHPYSHSLSYQKGYEQGFETGKHKHYSLGSASLSGRPAK